MHLVAVVDDEVAEISGAVVAAKESVVLVDTLEVSQDA